MLGKSHFAIGMTAAAWTAYALPLPTMGTRVMVGTVVAVGSLAPDIDHANSKISRSGGLLTAILCWVVLRFGDHRGWTHHVLIGPPVFGAVTAAGMWFMPGPIGTAWWALGLAMMIGCYAHIYADARTVSGTPLPGGGRLRIGRTFVTGSDAELWRYRLLYRPAGWVSVIAALWLSVK